MGMNPRNSRRRQGGVLLAWLALFLMVMIGFIAVGVDLAKLAVTQAQRQAAADAAALAGCTAVDSIAGTLVQANAIARAQEAGAKNKAYQMVPTSVVIDGSDVSFPTTSSIKVIARREGDTGMVT